jgi:hypothetical protein
MAQLAQPNFVFSMVPTGSVWVRWPLEEASFPDSLSSMDFALDQNGTAWSRSPHLARFVGRENPYINSQTNDFPHPTPTSSPSRFLPSPCRYLPSKTTPTIQGASPESTAAVGAFPVTGGAQETLHAITQAQGRSWTIASRHRHPL